jgi:cytochrome c peroxidase
MWSNCSRRRLPRIPARRCIEFTTTSAPIFLAAAALARAALIGAALAGFASTGAAADASAAPDAGADAASANRQPFYANTFEKVPSAAALTALGRELFADAGLSASGKLACASCHDPQHDFGPPNDLAVQRGGDDGRSFGVRAVPSLKYTQNVPPFTEHFVDDEEDDSVDQGPAGGRMWDGRSQSFHDQARLPLFSPFEMANRDADSVVARVQAGHAAQFRRVFGARIFADRALAFKGVLMALEAFQQSPAEFYPYSSKYDAFLRHRILLSARESRGLRAFNDPERGNCARCHPSGMQKGALPQFTDYGFAAIGAPRNAGIPANGERDYYDLGLCGPLRTDLKDRAEYCGLFRTPSLRNVARRGVFLHNAAAEVVSRLERRQRIEIRRLAAALCRQCGCAGAVRSACGRGAALKRAGYCGYRGILAGSERRV